MNDVSLEDVLALNEELSALAAAGVPIELGDLRVSTDDALAKINANLVLRTSLGQTVAAALADETQFPAIYQHAVLTGLESNQLCLTLDGVSRQPLAWDDLSRTVRQAFLQPLVLFALAYCGFISLCLWFGPSLASVYEQMRVQPNLGVRILAFCREWMPVWVPLVPLLVVIAVLFWRMRSKPQRPWLPGSQRYFATVTNAMFAEQIASLLAAGVPISESVVLAGNASGDAALIAASDAVAAHDRGEQLSTAQVQSLAALPPLLSWALTGDLGGEPLPEMLRFIGETYRQSSERQAAVWHVVLPTLVGAVAGGMILLVYCLCMFGSYIGLLRDLAS